MPANTVTGQDILFKIAQDTGEVLTEFITTVTSQTVLVVRGLGRGQTFKYALARVLGKGIRSIWGWDESTETLTLAAAFSTNVGVGELIQVMGWEGTRRNLMMQAVNEAIGMSWQWWGQDTEVNAASATITLAAGDNNYDLPSGIGKLLKVGIQVASTEPIEWFEPFQARFDVIGQEGAFEIVFRHGFAGGGYGGAGSWSSRVRVGGNGLDTFADAFAGQKLCLKYVARASELTSESGTTQLPLDYFTTASVIYLENLLRQLRDEAEIGLTQGMLGILMPRALEAQGRLSKSKPRMEQVARLKW